MKYTVCLVAWVPCSLARHAPQRRVWLVSFEPDRDQLPLGMQPGINTSPLGPVMRTPATCEEAARPLRTFLMTTVPVVVVLVVAILAVRYA